MPAYFDEKRRTWYCKFYYKDYTGMRIGELRALTLSDVDFDKKQ